MKKKKGETLRWKNIEQGNIACFSPMTTLVFKKYNETTYAKYNVICTAPYLSLYKMLQQEQ